MIDNKKLKTMRRLTYETKWLSYKNRLSMLKKLKTTIIANQSLIEKALYEDLGKNYLESYMTEIGIVLSELSFVIKKLKKWMKPKRVKTPLALFKAKSYLYNDPYGVVLILAPWNYPFQLNIMPLIGAIAAGNTVILKPSPDAPQTANIIEKIIKETFNKNEVDILIGSNEKASMLLDLNFDYIFFTGSIPIGKMIYEKAASKLIPVTLELGGKSPVIIDDNVNLELAARRIAFGKTLNAGQTCIAPDYLYIKEKDIEVFIKAFNNAIKDFFGKNVLANKSYPKIINDKHLKRLKSYIKNNKVIAGGTYNNTKIVPTILKAKDKNSKLLTEEIFGPILSLITYESLDEVINEINSKPHSLSIYVFSKNKKNINRTINELRFGGATINDTVMHFTNHNLPFGGVGKSGIGKYHGKYSYLTFSNQKGIVKRSTLIDLNIRYHPYTISKQKVIKRMFK